MQESARNSLRREGAPPAPECPIRDPANPAGEIDCAGIQSSSAILICAGIAIYGIDIRSFSAYIAPEPAVPRYENGLF